MKRPILTMPAILLLVVLLVFAPSFIMGLQNERNAREALAVGNYLEAAEQFELAAQRLYWKPELWNDAGKYYSESDLLAESMTAYSNAKKRNALDACGWITFGVFSGDSVDIWHEGLRHYPNAPLLYIGLANDYYSFGEIELEREYILKALENKENLNNCSRKMSWDFSRTHYRAGILLMQDNPARALDELNTAALVDERYAPVVETLRTTLNLASLENDPAEKLVVIGRGLGLAEEWQLAASAFHDATQADVENASAWAWLGEAQQQLGDDPLDAFEIAASINPNDPTLLSLRALYYQRQNDLDAALTDVAKLAAVEPENPNWQVSLGALYAERGDLPIALAAYEKAVELAPGEARYRALLALFSFNYGYDMEGRGLSAARRAVILAPDEAGYIDTLGLVYFGLERDDDAERQFLRALEKDPGYAAAHLHLGMLYLQRGHLDLASASLNNANAFATDEAVSAEAQRLLTEYFSE